MKTKNIELKNQTLILPRTAYGGTPNVGAGPTIESKPRCVSGDNEIFDSPLKGELSALPTGGNSSMRLASTDGDHCMPSCRLAKMEPGRGELSGIAAALDAKNKGLEPGVGGGDCGTALDRAASTGDTLHRASGTRPGVGGVFKPSGSLDSEVSSRAVFAQVSAEACAAKTVA